MRIKKLLFTVFITLVLVVSFSFSASAFGPIITNTAPDYSLVAKEYNYNFDYPKSSDFNSIPSSNKVCLNGFFINQEYKLKYYEFIATSSSGILGTRISYSCAPLYVNNVGQYSYTYFMPCFYIHGTSGVPWNYGLNYEFKVYDVATDHIDSSSPSYSVQPQLSMLQDRFYTLGYSIAGYGNVGNVFYSVYCSLENSCIGMYFPVTEFASPYSYKSSTDSDYIPFEADNVINRITVFILRQFNYTR